MTLDIVTACRLAEDQLEVARRADLEERKIVMEDVRTVGGCSQLSLAGGVVASAAMCFELDGLRLIAGSWACTRSDFNYEATYLTYREGPALVKAMDSLPTTPDVLLVPAAGVDHPRGIGMARHIGYLLSIPTVGVTRRPLGDGGYAGENNRPNGPYDRKPSCFAFSPGPGRAGIFISRGWRTDDSTSRKIVQLSMRDHRMPEPIHIAKTICRGFTKAAGFRFRNEG